MKQLNWYQIFGKSNIPDGRTVLPTDDIQIWLNCANIWDKTYTTLAEVLADTDTLSALIASSNAVDYMVRSTTWAVAVGLVPTMTSNTTPEGEVIFSTYYSAERAPYKAFSGWTDYPSWTPSAGDSVNNCYVGYHFTSPAKAHSVKVQSIDGGGHTVGYSIQGANVLGTWTTLGSDSIKGSATPGTVHEVNLNQYDSYDYYRILVTSINSTITDVGLKAQFNSPSIVNDQVAMSYIGLNNYCANTLLADSTWCEAICNSEYFESVLNVKIPKMTSDTTPSGKAFGDSIETSYPAYKAMDGNDTSYALSLGNATNPTFGYTFTANRSIYLAVLLVSSSANSSVTYTCKLQGSNDEFINDVHDITEAFTYSASINDKITVKKVCTLLSGSSSYRAINTARTSSAARFMAYSIQFYGREDV